MHLLQKKWQHSKRAVGGFARLRLFTQQAYVSNSNPQLLEEEGLLGFVVLILESEADAHSPDGAGELLAQAVQ